MKNVRSVAPLAALAALLCAFPALAQDVGRVAPASLPVPLAAAQPVPPNVLRATSPSYRTVTGTWKFALTHGHIASGGRYVSEQALNGAITSSSSEAGNYPIYAFDGDPGTRWCAASGDFPQWLQADLGAVRRLTSVNVTWERGSAHYQCKLEGSVDKKTWATLADETAAPGIGSGPIAITPGDYRYFKLTVTGADPGSWASISECQIHYTGDGGDTIWQGSASSAHSYSTLAAFAQPGYDDSHWDNIPVPSNWEVLGYSLPTYNSVDNTVGQYRRTIDVPAAWAGQKIYWRFDGALDGAELFVNGQRAGYHESGYTAFDVDVTGLLKPGQRNLLAVRVSKSTPSDDCETGDFQCMGGIFRETALIAVPPTHVSDISIQTPLSADYKNATLKASIVVQTSPGKTITVVGKLVNAAGVATGPKVDGTAVANADGVADISVSTPVTSPALWSAEKPNLYYLVMQLSRDGRPVERVEQRFGFKQIEIKNHVVLWNGMPIKCTGTCRHDFWADKGFALTDTEWNKDLTLMKAANINAIRTSHYNHAERFLELCEERGMYILDEIPFCWIGNSVNDPAYTPFLVQRATETLARDKNRPCVLAWSIGNENPYGPDELTVLNTVKSIDPTRPAFVSCQSPDQFPLQDWEDGHYPEPAKVDTDALNTKRTYNYSENPHIFYQKETQDYDPGASDLWSEALARVWNKIWKAPNILGSFIWEWQNQGIADRNSDKTTDYYYGPGRLRQENNKGVVDAYRRPKPEWWIVKQVYSPVHIDVRTVTPSGAHFVVPIVNRYSFTDIKELTTRWTDFEGTAVVKSGVEHLSCPPLQSVEASFPAPTGTTMLRLEFDHPGGEPVVAYNLSVSGSPAPQPPASLSVGQPLTSVESTETLTVSNNIERIVFHKQDGTIQSWQVRGKDILIGGPVVNLGELKASTEKNFYEAAKAPVTRDASVTAEPADSAGNVLVTVVSNVLSGVDGAAIGTLTCEYRIKTNAQIGVTWSLNWTGQAASLWEAGLTFSAPSAFSRMAWWRDSYFTDYPAGHIGEPSGLATAADVSFRSSKRNLHWMTLTDGQWGVALIASNDIPLVGRAHAGDQSTTLFASREVAGPRDFSGSWVTDHDINARPGTPLVGAFTLRAVETSR